MFFIFHQNSSSDEAEGGSVFDDKHEVGELNVSAHKTNQTLFNILGVLKSH